MRKKPEPQSPLNMPALRKYPEMLRFAEGGGEMPLCSIVRNPDRWSTEPRNVNRSLWKKIAPLLMTMFEIGYWPLQIGQRTLAWPRMPVYVPLGSASPLDGGGEGATESSEIRPR